MAGTLDSFMYSLDTFVQIKYLFAVSSTGNNTMRTPDVFLKSVFHSPLYVVTLKADLSACWPSHTLGRFCVHIL